MNTLESANGSRHLALDSVLTIYTAADTKLLLANALHGAVDLRLDLSAIEEVDCAGLQLLLAACQEARRQHVSLHLEGASPAMTEILQLSGLHDLLLSGGLH
ncbi:sulfate transporter/antisigma-factor antagonist STAS [Ectopseudomonas mendocina]|uniref:Anti-anti-sigma factor n=1 Tax=Ectopseudomonas oleovorans TaxID=301 RepID=A0A397M8J7_ECTOL|nr:MULTISPECIES: STAS domain-containing protein [Pseudomonas aeruginosa group]RIA21330.1 anti-anti-sigma factor [Pseudomonas oleovorans]SUD35722.1 sulfate transporter/antisigma-factor antagonist STAS [Pseudomonas mendocina]